MLIFDHLPDFQFSFFECDFFIFPTFIRKIRVKHAIVEMVKLRAQSAAGKSNAKMAKF